MPEFVQHNGDWQELAKGARVRLFRWSDSLGDWVWFDYGLKSLTNKYLERGLMVKPDKDWAHPSTIQLPTDNKPLDLKGFTLRKLAD